jgi:hypothetical protein
MPPSAAILVPVMYLAKSLTRKAARRPISSGSPIRPINIFSSRSARPLGDCQTLALIGVRIAPGARASARPPLGEACDVAAIQRLTSTAYPLRVQGWRWNRLRRGIRGQGFNYSCTAGREIRIGWLRSCERDH